jgi:hypothetical protein
MDVIRTHIQGVKPPGPIVANLGYGRGDGPALLFAKKHRLLG